MVYYHTREWIENEEGNNSVNGVGPKNGNQKTYHKALNTVFDYVDNVIDNELLNMKENIRSWW